MALTFARRSRRLQADETVLFPRAGCSLGDPVEEGRGSLIKSASGIWERAASL
jgi:hypothetical protein